MTSLADRLKVDLALIHREKYHNQEDDTALPEEVETRLTLVGDVKGKIAVMIVSSFLSYIRGISLPQDDMIDGTHSFLDAAIHLKHCEASKVVIIATHGILSGDSAEEIQFCDAVDEVLFLLFIINVRLVAHCYKHLPHPSRKTGKMQKAPCT